MDGIVRKACPVCGGQISIQECYTFIIERTTSRKTGLVSKRYRRIDASYDDQDSRHAACMDCGAFWDDNDFYVDDDWRFIDRKYRGIE